MTQNYYELFLLLGLVLVASVGGVLALYSYTIMPALKKLDDATFVRVFAAIDRQIVRSVFMVQFFVPLFILAGVAIYAFSQQLDSAALVAGAFACYLGVIAVTVGVNVPLNDGIKSVADTISAQEFARARMQFNEQKWTVFNHVRMVLSIAAIVLLAVVIS